MFKNNRFYHLFDNIYFDEFKKKRPRKRTFSSVKYLFIFLVVLPAESLQRPEYMPRPQ